MREKYVRNTCEAEKLSAIKLGNVKINYGGDVSWRKENM